MNRIFFEAALLSGLFASVATSHASTLRIHCGDDGDGAEVSINGVFKGECPLDVQVPAGELKIRARLAQPGGVDRIAERTMRIGDGVVKSLDLELAENVDPHDRQSLAKLKAVDAKLGDTSLSKFDLADLLLQKASLLHQLGRYDAALPVLKQVGALDPRFEPSGMLSWNALARLQRTEALPYAEANLNQDVTKPYAHFSVGMAQYLAGNPDRASSAFDTAARSPDRVAYATLWLWLTARRLGDDPNVAVAPFEAAVKASPWPWTLLQALEGRIDRATAVAATQIDGHADRERECELYFYLGEKAFLQHDDAAARADLQRSIDSHVYNFNEYVSALNEMQRLKQVAGFRD